MRGGRTLYLSLLPSCCDKHHEQKQLVEARKPLWLAGYSHHWGRPGQFKQEPSGMTAYWLAFHGLLILLSYRAQDHRPKNVTAHNSLDPSR